MDPNVSQALVLLPSSGSARHHARQHNQTQLPNDAEAPGAEPPNRLRHQVFLRILAPKEWTLGGDSGRGATVVGRNESLPMMNPIANSQSAGHRFGLA